MDRIWKPKKSLKDSRRMVVDAIETAFTPDLQVKVNEHGNITGTNAVTILGAEFLMNNCILEKNYDDVKFYNITVETEFQNEKN